ncbi:MAG: multicopper oxidase domain-containing protein [Chitinophagaceae bacterium]
MKHIILIAFVLAIYSSAFAQMPMNMPMPKEKTKNVRKKPSPQKHDAMQMSKDTSSPKKEEMQMDMSMDMSKSKDTSEDMDLKMPQQIAEKVNLSSGKTVRYDLYVKDTMVNFTGKSKHAIAINGSIPASTLTFTEGDTAEIYLHNMLKTEETSLHWHGVILPNEADGVPYLTTAPIPPGTTHLYKFAVVQNGTYWYHSHSALQEQSGMYGALVFKKRDEQQPMKEYTLVLSDWTNEKPYEVQRRLRSMNDWYAIQKGSTQSYAEAIKQGYFKAKLTNEWKRMKAMDVSDVYYDRFLANGKPENAVPQFNAGEKVRLRIVNAGASSYFWLQYAGGKLTVVGNDGNDVEPVEVDRMIIAPAETYDVVVTIPDNMSYEFRATAEDRTKAASLWLGSGMKMNAPALPKLKYFEGMKMMNDMMKMNGDMKMMQGMDMSNQTMDMNTVMYPEITGYGKSEGNTMDKMMNMKDIKMDSSKNMKTNDMKDMKMNEQKKDSMPGMKMDNMKGMKLKNTQQIASSTSEMARGETVTLNYGMLRSLVKTTLPDVPYKELHFMLTGNMNRYVWSINNKTVNESDKILIEKGQNVRIILFNNSMMRHPMHLHGHDFRVLNGQGEYAPLKNVLDIMPMERDTIEFAANQSGNWFFHCHILYHMMTGMGNVFSYVNSPVNPELPDAAQAYKNFKQDNRMSHPMAKVGLESNGSEGEIMLAGNRYALQETWHLGLHPEHGYESETNFGRYFGKMQWLFPYVGFDYHYKKVGSDIKNIFGDEKFNMLGQSSDKDNRKTFVAGVQYTLPTLIIADARVDGNGKFRFQLSREDVPVTNRLRFNFMVNTDKEYAAGFRYIVRKWFSLSTHYDSDMGYGAGVTLTY